MSLSSASLTFSPQAAGTISPAQTITVTNTGNAPLTISQITAAGDFTSTDTCISTPIAAGATCTIQISFLPTTTGARTGTLTIYGNIPGGQSIVSLSGTGTRAATIVLNPVTITFPATLTGSTSTAQTSPSPTPALSPAHSAPSPPPATFSSPPTPAAPRST